MYTDDNLIESLANNLRDLRHKMVEFVFAANDFYVFCRTEFGRIRSEYVAVGFLCDVATVVSTIALNCLRVIIKQLFCMRVEPWFQATWNKIGYISISNMCFDMNTFFTYNLYNIKTNVYVEDPLDDYDLDKLNNPTWISTWTGGSNGAIFMRKTAYGERIVRQLYPDKPVPDFNAIMDMVPEKTEVRLLLVYLQFEDHPANTFDIQIPIEEYYVGNEILSHEYIASYMEHQWIWNCYNYDWRADYIVRIMDSDLNIFEMNKDEYIRFEKNGLLVCGMEDCSDSDESTPGLRTVSLESDAEMLMLFSETARDRASD